MLYHIKGGKKVFHDLSWFHFILHHKNPAVLTGVCAILFINFLKYPLYVASGICQSVLLKVFRPLVYLWCNTISTAAPTVTTQATIWYLTMHLLMF